MAAKKQPERRTIAGMECLNKNLAADRCGMEISAFNKLIALERAGLTKIHLKWIQTTKGAPMWFPVEFIDSFVMQVLEKGRAY